MDNNIIYHYTKTENAFSIIIPEHKNELKWVTNEIAGFIKYTGQKPHINTNDIVKNYLLNNKNKVFEKNRFHFCLKASSIDNVNDPTEKKIGYRWLKDSYVNDEDFKKNILEIEENHGNKSIISTLNNNSYITSFSEIKNDLNQWRLYSNDGKGIAIGIDLDILYQLSTTPFAIDFNKVFYFNKDINKDIEIFFGNYKVKKHNEELKNIKKTDDETNSIISKLVNIMLLSSLPSFVKDDCYSSEKEYRFYVNPIFLNYYNEYKKVKIPYLEYFLNFKDQEKHFYFTDNKIIAYKEIPIPMTALKEIWLGPKNNSQISLVEDFLYILGYNDVKVYKSDLPYK